MPWLIPPRSSRTHRRQRHLPATLSVADETILRAIACYYQLTARQLTRLPTTPHTLRTNQRLLQRLAERRYLGRTFVPRPTRSGSTPIVYQLSRKGVRYLDRLGIPSQPVSRRRSPATPFLAHSLAVTDVLIAAACLAETRPDLTLGPVLTETQLARRPLTVTLPDGRNRRVQPDAWFVFELATTMGPRRLPIALELDRGTMAATRWRQKVQAILAWASGPYQQAFQSQALTIAVVATPGPARAAALRRWTEAELQAQDRPDLADLFRFLGVVPDQVPPATLFGAPHWQVPFGATPVPLIPGEEVQVVP